MSAAAGPAPGDRVAARVARLGRVAGPLLALLAAWLLPETYRAADGSVVAFPPEGRATAAVAVWMAVWWLTEAIDVSATALLPLVLLPLLGAARMQQAASPYAHELIFLFLGGFLLALAMERWGLHRRMALVALRVVGDRPGAMVAGFMGATAFLSMWVSNTATAIMMLPVARSVIDRVERQQERSGAGRPASAGEDADALEAALASDSPVRPLALCLLLGVAYAASIGGIATPIGTPPNLFLLSYLREFLDREVSFVRWMGVGLPLVAVYLPLAWLLLTRVLHPIRMPRVPGGRALVREALHALGPMSRPERITLAAFGLAALAWITRPLLVGLEVAGAHPLAGLTDAGIAMLAAMALFVMPAGGGHGAVLDWATARRVPWGILILFGGGLSLAAAIRANQVGELLAAQVAGFGGLPMLLLVAGVVALVIFLTELTSNTATTATFVPILASLAPGLGMDPLELAVPAAIAASCAFMLPVATPPNAIVFGSGLVRIRDMARAGLWLNVLGILLITALTWAVVMPLLGARPGP